MKFTCTTCGSEFQADLRGGSESFTDDTCPVCGSDYNVTGWGKKIKPCPWVADLRRQEKGGYQEDLDRFTLKGE